MIVLRDVVPSLRWIHWGGHEKKMKKTATEIDGFLGKWLQEHKKKRFLGEEEDGKDFMDVEISFLNGQDTEGYDADTATKATCLGMIVGPKFLFAGYESVALALTWPISTLLDNNDVMKRDQEELDTHAGKERMVNDMDISKLVYLQAIVKELIRLFPPAFIPGPRKFVEDCVIGGYHIPEGTWLLTNFWTIHTDPKIWPNPMEFRPEQFLTTHKEVDVKGQHFELLPFGGSRRECPAKFYGIQMIHFTLASLLHAFDISEVNGIGLTDKNVADLEIIAWPRLSSYCYE